MSKLLLAAPLLATLVLAGCKADGAMILPASAQAFDQGKARAMRECGGPVWVWDVQSATSVQPFRVYWTVLYRCKSTAAFIGPYQITQDL